MKKTIQFLLKILVSAGIIVFLFYKFDLDWVVIGHAIMAGRWYSWGPILVLALLVLWLKSMRWRELVRLDGTKLTWREAYCFYLSSYTLGIVTPGRLGEFFKIYQLYSAKQTPARKAFISVFADRLFDLIFLFWMGLSGFFYWGCDGLKDNFPLACVVGFLISLLLFVVGHRLLHWIALPSRFQRGNELLRLLACSIDRLACRSSLKAWGISLLAYAVYFYSNWLILTTCGVGVSYSTTCMVFGLVGLVLLIPISIAGLGTREATMIVVLAQYGYADNAIVAGSLCQFFIYCVLCGAIGGIVLNVKGIRFRLIRDDLIRLRNSAFLQSSKTGNPATVSDMIKKE